MTDNKHTPGPWKWEDGTCETFLLDEKGNYVLSVGHNTGWSPSDHDALLIAASPILLEAAELGLKRLIVTRNNFYTDTIKANSADPGKQAILNGMNRDIATIEAAIKKATA